MQNPHRTVGEIAAEQPAATRVFLRHKIDFCCGGQRTLAEACRKVGADPTTVEREIADEAARGTSDRGWEGRPAAELVEHIETRYHEALRRNVPALIDAARRVERVHVEKPDVPAGLADTLVAFWADMQSHMYKEEHVLFPMLARGARPSAVAAPIGVMMAEHEEHAVNLARIRQLTGQITTPPHACATWRALYDGLRHLDEELVQHIHLENHVLFR